MGILQKVLQKTKNDISKILKENAEYYIENGYENNEIINNLSNDFDNEIGELVEDTD